jgi:hypothetical protein
MNDYVGVDLADRKHDVCILDSSGVILHELSFHILLKDWINSFLKSENFQQMYITYSFQLKPQNTYSFNTYMHWDIRFIQSIRKV